jgi:hypothetical protein
MTTSSGAFCADAIETVKWLIAGYCGDPLIRRYVNSLYKQFVGCGSRSGSNINLT